ncbi:MAG: Oxidoreductase, aldo/keto reductase family, partial [uncultured Cytophagales bacterium]
AESNIEQRGGNAPFGIRGFPDSRPGRMRKKRIGCFAGGRV